jgi:hypothetical protein
MRRMELTLMLIAGTLAAPALHADPVCVLAPGAEALLEAAGPISGWSCEPIRSGRWQDPEMDTDLLKKVGKWELKLLDTGEQHHNRTRMSFGTKGLRLKVAL